jgi:hypothetical protein
MENEPVTPVEIRTCAIAQADLVSREGRNIVDSTDISGVIVQRVAVSIGSEKFGA